MRATISTCWLIASALLAATQEAQAVPAFADQTGLHCSDCHIGAFGPQLTAVGRAFKLGGYTLRAKEWSVPVSAMAIASFVNTQKDQVPPPATHYAANNNTTIDQLSLFLAAGLGDHFGAFSQFTYDGVGRSFGWDNIDLRAVDTEKLFGRDTILGVSLNNNPTVEDVFATLLAWSFPFTTSTLAPTPSAAPILSGVFSQNVVGLDAYAWWNNTVYAEAGFYRSLSKGILRAVGVDPGGTDLIDGEAPYLRLAWFDDMKDRNFQVGAFALLADVFPGRDQSAGQSDGIRDFGADASYQFLGSGETIATANARYTHEDHDLAASDALGLAANRSDTLDEVMINASYYWDNTIGATIEHFQVWGSRDATLYAANRTFRPDSTGFIFQVDGTPWGKGQSPLGNRLNLRAGLQYIAYTQFNGAGTNFDGAGRNAWDNNTLRLFLWAAF